MSISIIKILKDFAGKTDEDKGLFPDEVIFSEYKRTAKKVLQKVVKFTAEERVGFYKKYQKVLKHAKQEIKLTSIYDCLALEHGYVQWENAKKSFIEQIILLEHEFWIWADDFEKLSADEKKKRQQKLAKKDSEFFLRNMFEVYERTGPERKKIKNLYLPMLNLSHKTNDEICSPLCGGFSWLNLEGCNFSKCVMLNVSFERAICSNVNFNQARFGGKEAYDKLYHGKKFKTLYIQEPYFWLARFHDCNFSYADLHFAYMREASFIGCNFSNAKLINANCFLVDFSNCDLSGVDFTGADLKGANFTNAVVKNAIFRDAELSGVQCLNVNEV
ncbi:MAG: pentapeptide repeat-containing protein [Gammaproteobacteria bacterium]|nr:pentapeptide repeat-containing protein [Gammaproteobacteria bacterium]